MAVVSAYTGVMSSLLSKLSVLLNDQYKQRKGVRRDIEFLTRELTDMNAALEKLAGMDQIDGQTKVWRDKVREMAYDIEDCIDTFMHRLSNEDEKDGLFYKIASKIRKLREYYQHANKIQELKARVEELSQSRDRYKVDECISKSRVVEVDPRLPALFEDAKRLVGIDGPREEITKWLMEEGNTDFEQLKVVSIVGFGGLGKTTLANQVYTKIKNRFQCTAFVSVSRTPDIPIILKDILYRVGYGGTMEMEDDVQKLIEILRTHLMNKRYLIIIDDLWSIQDWCTIKCAFVENNKGSRVITTTRHQDVATACCFPCKGHVYPMKPLDVHHSRRLFFKRLFDTEDGCPNQFSEISNDMLRKCKGVPLAIISIASLLANQNMHVETWEKIRNSLGYELDANPTMEWMRHVLILSYNDLPHDLKTCLLYLSVYPEDQEISMCNLVRKWTAEGFVSEKHGLDLEEAAEDCFNELINRSMIQPCFNRDTGKVWGCRVHDLMLDLIVSKCKEENFISIIDMKSTTNGAQQVRRVSHQFNNKDMALAIERMSSSQVRTYNFFAEGDCIPPLSKFELLRVLDMDQGSHMRGHPMLPLNMKEQSMCLDLSAINHLLLLRYLKVSGFRLELPKKWKLHHLMTLDMLWSGLYPTKQSSDFTSLSSLRHLALPSSIFQGILDLRNGLSKLCNLRTLSSFDIGANSIECIRDLSELANLRALNVTSRHRGEHNRFTILAASLDKIGNNNLRHLSFSIGPSSMTPSTEFWSNCLTRPRHLQTFYYLNNSIPMIPKWMAHAHRLASLGPLNVQELRSDDIQVLAQLPCLFYLGLRAETIPEENIIVHPNTFPSLKYLDFRCKWSCLAFQPAAMPQLQRLSMQLSGCRQCAMQLPEDSPASGVEHLDNLEKIYLSIWAECGHRSNIESAWRDSISRHPKSEAIRICVPRIIRSAARISGGD